MKSSRKSSTPGRTATLPGEPHVARVDGLPQAQASLGGYGMGWGSGQGYGMADQSTARGYIYFPQLDTKKEITTYTRTEGLRKARFLESNVGLAGRMLNGMGRMSMGTGLMPVSTTRAKEWNKLVKRRMDIVLNSPLTYDLSGKQDFFSAQASDMSTGFRDGDLGKAYARDEGGNLRVAYYEGHQINGQPAPLSVTGDTPLIFDGVHVDRHNRALGFLIQSGEQAGQSVEIPAADFALLCNFTRKGASRGVTILKHAINKMVDRGELEAMTSKGMKNAARIGYALTRDVAAPPGVAKWSANPTTTQTVTKSDGNTARIKMEEVQDNNGGEIPQLPPGMDIKMLMDTRPHPNTMEFFDYIARDAAMGCDWPHELLYNIWKLGGANTRYVMADAQSIIEREQARWVMQVGSREYIAFLAEEIRTGRIPKCPDPEWWAHEFIPPPRMTVDFSRDGKMYLQQIQSGALTFKRFFGWQGLDNTQLDEWLDEMKYIQDGCRTRFFGEDGKPDPHMEQFVLQAMYQRVGLASSLDSGPTAEEIAQAQADQNNA